MNFSLKRAETVDQRLEPAALAVQSRRRFISWSGATVTDAVVSGLALDKAVDKGIGTLHALLDAHDRGLVFHSEIAQETGIYSGAALTTLILGFFTGKVAVEHLRQMYRLKAQSTEQTANQLLQTQIAE